jgi:hypothetical protein
MVAEATPETASNAATAICPACFNMEFEFIIHLPEMSGPSRR